PFSTVFFFSDSATTYFFTLSLHDALPIFPIHHLEGHLLSPMLSPEVPEFPFVALLVSGGHTQLMRVDAVGQYELLGETLDDAAGDRKSTRLNSSHVSISYAVFCLKKKKNK